MYVYIPEFIVALRLFIVYVASCHEHDNCIYYMIQDRLVIRKMRVKVMSRCNCAGEKVCNTVRVKTLSMF